MTTPMPGIPPPVDEDRDLFVELDQEAASKPEVKAEPEPEPEPKADAEVEVEIVDDTPPEDRRPPRRETAEETPLEEKEALGKRVQHRISKLKFDVHDMRRRAEQAERERDQAAAWAKNVYTQKQQLEQQVAAGQKVSYDSTLGRLDAEILNTRQSLRQATELGDADKIAEATEKMSMLAAQRQNIAMNFQPPPQPQQPAAQQLGELQPPPQVEQYQAQMAQKFQRQLQEWQGRNPWFAQDKEMTDYALAMHHKALTEDLIPGSIGYLKFIDQQMVATFPEKLGHAAPAKPKPAPQIVAPSVRSNGAGSKKLVLPKSAAETAKRLGVPLAEYARYYQENEANG